MSRGTALPQTLDTVILQSTDFYKQVTDFNEIIDNFLRELSISIEYEGLKSAQYVYNSLENFYTNLNNNNFTLSGKELDNAFIDLWVEKFNCFSTDIKNSIRSVLPLKSFFNEISDDVGTILSTQQATNSTTVPWFDVFYDKIDTPTTIPHTCSNKVSLNNKINNKIMYKLCDGMMRVNMLGMVDYTSLNTQKTAHSDNLVTDYDYLQSLFAFSNILKDSLFNILGNVASYIFFIKTYNNRTKRNRSHLLPINIKIEDVKKTIDILRNQLGSPKENPFLSVDFD